MTVTLKQVAQFQVDLASIAWDLDVDAAQIPMITPKHVLGSGAQAPTLYCHVTGGPIVTDFAQDGAPASRAFTGVDAHCTAVFDEGILAVGAGLHPAFQGANQAVDMWSMAPEITAAMTPRNAVRTLQPMLRMCVADGRVLCGCSSMLMVCGGACRCTRPKPLP